MKADYIQLTNTLIKNLKKVKSQIKTQKAGMYKIKRTMMKKFQITNMMKLNHDQKVNIVILKLLLIKIYQIKKISQKIMKNQRFKKVDHIMIKKNKDQDLNIKKNKMKLDQNQNQNQDIAMMNILISLE